MGLSIYFILLYIECALSNIWAPLGLPNQKDMGTQNYRTLWEMTRSPLDLVDFENQETKTGSIFMSIFGGPVYACWSCICLEGSFICLPRFFNLFVFYLL